MTEPTSEQLREWIEWLAHPSSAKPTPDIGAERVLAAFRALLARQERDTPKQGLVVYAVVYSSYADDETAGLYMTKESAETKARELGGMWEVSEWPVNP